MIQSAVVKKQNGFLNKSFPEISHFSLSSVEPCVGLLSVVTTSLHQNNTDPIVLSQPIVYPDFSGCHSENANKQIPEPTNKMQRQCDCESVLTYDGADSDWVKGSPCACETEKFQPVIQSMRSVHYL